MATPGYLDLGTIVQGDTWNGIGPAIVFSINGSPPSNPLAEAYLQFRKTYTSQAGETLAVGDGITINNASTWHITVPERNLSLCAGDWIWDLEVIDTAGRIKTWLAGKLKVLPQVTREPYHND